VCVCVCVFMMSSTNLGNCWELAILEKCYQNGQHRYRQTHVLPIRTTQIQNTDAQAAVVQIQIYVCTYVCMTIHMYVCMLSVYKYVCCRWWKKEESQEKNTTEKRRQKCSQAFATSFVSCCGSGGGIVFRRWGNTLRENAHCPFAMVIPVSNLQPWQFDATS